MPKTTKTAKTRTAHERLAAMIDPERVPVGLRSTRSGYLDVLEDLPPARTVGAWAMRTSFYPVLYERFRPTAFRVASAFAAPGKDGDRVALAQRLSLAEGDLVLDVGCGPGNFTGYLGSAVGPGGLAVGLDASDSMLAKAVATNSGPSVEYLRGNAERLPFLDASVDAVACLAALYLINEPYAAIEEMARVLRPGGRISVMTSYRPGGPVGHGYGTALYVTTGIRAFGGDAITSAFGRVGLVDVQQRIEGLSQSVWARKP